MRILEDYFYGKTYLKKKTRFGEFYNKYLKYKQKYLDLKALL